MSNSILMNDYCYLLFLIINTLIFLNKLKYYLEKCIFDGWGPFDLNQDLGLR